MKHKLSLDFSESQVSNRLTVMAASFSRCSFVKNNQEVSQRILLWDSFVPQCLYCVQNCCAGFLYCSQQEGSVLLRYTVNVQLHTWC